MPVVPVVDTVSAATAALPCGRPEPLRDRVSGLRPQRVTRDRKMDNTGATAPSEDRRLF